MPPDFPALTLPTMRALAVLYDESGGEGGDQTKLVAALDVLYAATWVERKATHKGDVLREVLGGVLGEGEAGRGMFLFFWVSWGGGGGGLASLSGLGVSSPSPPSTHPSLHHQPP